MFSAPHTATARRMVLTYSLKYDGGTAVFTAGKTLTGATSHATATISSTGSAASGTLVIYDISGTFQNDEPLSDNGTVPGAAVADGVVTGPNLDAYGQQSQVEVTTSISCRFFSKLDLNPSTGALTYAQDSLQVMMPPLVDLDNGDTLTSTATGYAETYVISALKPVYTLGILHHYTSRLARLS